MSKKSVEKQDVQEHPKVAGKDQSEQSYRMLEAEYVDSPHGRIAVRKEFRCIRCFEVKNFVLPESLVESVGSEETAGDFLLSAFAQVQGWIYTRATRDGVEYGYTLCPACVEKDYEAYSRFAKGK